MSQGNKKELFTGERRRRKLLPYVLLFTLLIGGLAFFFTLTGDSAIEVSGSGGFVKISLADVNDGKAHFFKYNTGSGKDVKFFVLKSADGVIRAAFDSCDVCYAAKKGYRQEGDRMVCNNCGQRFPSTGINEVRGGCNPAPLERAIDGGIVLIRAGDIETGSVYF